MRGFSPAFTSIVVMLTHETHTRSLRRFVRGPSPDRAPYVRVPSLASLLTGEMNYETVY